MKILLLGGTSFFGRDIVRAFAHHGHDVTIFTRGNHPPEDVPRLRHFKGDRQNLSELKKVAESEPWDVVVDNIAYDGDTVRKAIELFPKVKRYILTSTISVYRYQSESPYGPLREQNVDYDYNPKDEDLNDVHWKYARGKLEAEKALVRQDRVAWTIFRPTIVYGPNDSSQRGFWYLARLLKGGPILLANGGINAFRMVYSLDVAQAYAAALERPVSEGRIYNLSQGEVITPKDFIKDSAKALSVKPEFVSVPLEYLKEMGGPYAMDRTWIPTIQEARKDLHFRPTDWSTMISRTACWFRDIWKGDEAKLLEGREKEIQFAQKWAQLTKGL